MDGLKIAPRIFRTSHVHVGRIPQGARKAVRLYPWMDGMSQGAMDGGETNIHGWMVCLKEPWMAVRRMLIDELAENGSLTI